ncbi:MAG TPA: NAD(P)/FAD-dependent oxidoreductase [Desulfatiglandales bacterium]|nr:NAD(P)/FAD-dependent oxidoreductase [Desulfatiglandales bacterium]
MKTYECDVLIVGAGPAGSSAAYAASDKGWDVLMIDQRAIIGVPVRCAEYIPAPLMNEINIGKDFIIQHVKGMRTILPDGAIKESPAPGLMIRRDIFDQALAKKAEEAGSGVSLCTRLISMDENGALVQSRAERYRIKARIIIGADGPHTTVGRLINSRNMDLIPAIQIIADLTQRMDVTEVYFNKDLYGGYGWLFPKGYKANIGIAMRKRGGISCPIKECLQRFIARLRQGSKIRGEVSGWTAGWIPIGRPRTLVHKNIMLAGDAAGQTHPISGAGVAQAVICGGMAGKWAGLALAADDTAILSGYDMEWRDLYGDIQEWAYSRRALMEKEWDNLDDIIKRCWIGFREYYASP